MEPLNRDLKPVRDSEQPFEAQPCPGAGWPHVEDGEIRRKIENLRLILLKKVGPGYGLGHVTPEHAGTGQSSVSVLEIEDATEATTEYGRCLVIEKDLVDCPSPERLTEAHRVLRGVGGDGGGAGGLVFLDLETTGLSATPLFLAGMLVERGRRLKAVQLLARDYAEERCLIGILDGLLADCRICVTFNGKSFDLPYLKERAKYHRLPLRAAPEQLDLLHHARRRWKHHLPDCRLLTLEWHILGRRRIGDVDGWEVPCIYHEFVHTRDPRRLKGVLRHNLMDVLAMAELLVSLAEA